MCVHMCACVCRSWRLARSQVDLLEQEIDHAEEMLVLRLNSAQNVLLSWNTVVGLLAVCIGFGSLIAGIFGP